MTEALAMVRRELGPDALILRTRQVPRRGKMPWSKAEMETEIVAVADEKGAVTAEFSNSPATRKSTPEVKPAPQPASTSRVIRPQETAREKFRTEQKPETVETTRAARSETRLPVISQEKTASESEKLEALVKERLASLQTMVEELTEQVRYGMSREIPAELFSLYTQLIDADVEEGTAREMIGRLKRRCRPEDMSQPERLYQQLLEMMELEIPCRGEISLRPGCRKIVALIGPTGVGKTTTIAKLAANYRLKEKLNVGLITVDTYRIAAVDQLRTYAEIIDLPMRVVSNSTEMRLAVDAFADKDLVLIDTAGRSPRDAVQLHELEEVLSEIVVDEVQLVLSATASPRYLKKTIEQFQSVRPTAAILTKLDEATELGAIINVASRMNLPLSYLTTGQNVPHDIEPAHPRRAASLLLGQDSVLKPRPDARVPSIQHKEAT